MKNLRLIATIEERAIAIANRHTYVNDDTEYDDVIDAVVEAFTQQDTITRADERERCINAAQNWYCENHCLNGWCNDRRKLCSTKLNLQKAMEGGDNGNQRPS